MAAPAVTGKDIMLDQKLAREHDRLETEKARLQKALDGSSIDRVVWGMQLPLIGFRYIKSHPRLIWLLLVPVGFVIIATAVVAVTVGASLLATGLAGLGAGGPGGFIFACAGGLIISMLGFAALALAMGGAYMLMGPFLEFLLEEVEEREGTRLWPDYQQPPFSWAGAGRNLLLTGLHWIVWGAVLTLVGMLITPLPIIGVFIALYAVSVINVWVLTGDYVGTVHLWSFSDKVRFLKDRQSFLFGAAIPIVLVPAFTGVGILFMPFLAPCGLVGTTLMILWLQDLGEEVPEDGRQPPRAIANAADAVGQQLSGPSATPGSPPDD